MPFMARPSYRAELLSWSLLPVMISGIQYGSLAIIVKKLFANVPGLSGPRANFAIALITAGRASGHLVSFVWDGVSRGYHRVQFLFWLQCATAFLIGMIGFATISVGGLRWITTLSLAAWIAWSGVVTLRSSVWRTNYSTELRPRIAGKFATVEALVAATMGLAIGWSLDRQPQSFHVIFPLLAGFGLIGAFAYRRVPLRRASQLGQRRRMTTVSGVNGTDGEVAAIRHTASSRVTFTPGATWQILCEDRDYRNYLICMFVMGSGNLMLHAPLAIVLEEIFHVSYMQGIVLTTALPCVCLTLAIPFWSRMLQRRHVVQFRAIHAWVFVATSSLMFFATQFHNLGLLYAGSIFLGIALGGGSIAWNLGHQHYASPEKDSLYNGAHVTLCGIRGFLGPLIAVAAYNEFAKWHGQSLVFLLCSGLNIAGAFGFAYLAREQGVEKPRRQSLLATPPFDALP